MSRLKNLKEWKTSLIGVITYIISFYYLLEVEDSSVYIVALLLIFATLMMFSADKLVGSLSKFIKNNESKKL